jgi:hypothetical protein
MEESYMKYYILFGFILAVFIGTSLSQYPTISDVNAFQQALEKDGFTVQQGAVGFFDVIKLYDLGVLPNALGNNPSTRYLSYFVPPAPGQKVPEELTKIAATLGINLDATAFWNLGPDEAVVFVGRTPPECRYFSFDLQLVERTYGNEARWILSNIGDTVNNLVINTEGTPNGAAGNPFNQTTVIVATADRGIDQRIQAAALSAGYPDNIFNTKVLPSSMLNLGVESNSDKFLIAMRPAFYKDKPAGDDYLNNTPATVFRVTPNQTTKLDPYEFPKLRIRGTGTTEFDLMDDLEQLRMAILDTYSNLSATELPISMIVPLDGIQRGINAMGPANDACSLWTSNLTIYSPTPSFPDLSKYYDFQPHPTVTLGNDTNEFIIIYGVNHVATGKATYSNFAVYGAKGWNGVGAIHDAKFNGTAEAYLPDNPNAKYLYVYKIARNCNGDLNCFEVPTGPGAYGIALDQPLMIFWRMYLEKATKTGPSYSEIVYDRAIKFDPKT